MPEQTGIAADMRAVLGKVRRLARLFAFAAVGLFLLSGFYVVEPDERGVVKRFGRLVADDVEPGIHYRLPWPVESSDTPKVTSIRRMSVGYRIVDEVRGIPPDAVLSQFVTGDTNIIEIQLLVQYVVKDASMFLYASVDPQWLVGGVCESVLSETVARIGVDEALTTAKLEVQAAVKAGSQAVLDGYESGVEIAAVHIQDISPPREVAEAFRDVASAREDRNRITEEARGYANRVVPTARGEAQALVTAAEGYRTERVLAARGESSRFTQLVAEYRKAEAATRDRLYLEVMEEVLSTARKHIVDAQAGDAVLDLRFLSERE